MTTRVCPDRQRIHSLIHGTLPFEAVEELASHIETCPDCARTVSELGDDTLADALRAGGAGTDTADDIRIRAMIERHRIIVSSEKTGTISRSDEDSHPPLGSDATEADEPLDFLNPPQAPDELGRLGGYRILRRLGSGGMGLVFEAEDIKLERRVALKVMKRDIAKKAEHRERFLREARTAAKVESDHICPIYQVGEENGVPFIAMPFLKGEPLDARMRREAPLPLAEAVRIGREIAEGLAAAHDAGLIHRDIKPGNVWLESAPNRAPRARILDFGLARLANSERKVGGENLTHSGAILGTPAYMAPEQARAKAIDHRVDLFSLGVMLYEMTTGQRPFTGPDTMAILTSLALDTPAAPIDVNPQVPAVLSDLIVRLLAKEPEQRVQSAADVVRTLAAVEPKSRPTSVAIADPWTHIDVTEPVTPLTRRASKGNAQEHLLALRAHKSRLQRSALIALSLLFIGAVAFGAYQLIFKTKDGTLIVEVDGDADVRFQQRELRIYDTEGKLTYRLKPSEKNKKLPPGKYLVQVTGVDGLKLDTPEFTLEKNGKATVRVMVDQKAVAKKEPFGRDPKGIVSADPDRRAAEWVLSIGGGISIKENGQERQPGAVGDLPAGAFELTEVFLYKNPKVSDAGLVNFKDCKNLTALTLAEVQVSDAGLVHFKGCKNLTKLGLFHTPVGDAGLEHFKACKNLTQLQLRGTQVSDAGLAHFKDCKDLDGLGLESTKVSDAGLAHFRDCRNLAYLALDNTKVSEAGLAHFKDCKKLAILYLSRTQVSDAGLAHFKHCKSLTSLALSSTKVSDAGLAHFKDCKNLTYLHLHETLVSDAGLAHFKDCKNLTHLHLNNTKVSDAGLAHFKDCKNLTHLTLQKTKVTAKGIAELQKALPKCKIEWDGQ